MNHAPASFNSPSCGSHGWSLIQTLTFDTILGSPGLQCHFLQFTLHAVSFGPQVEVQFLGLALKVLPSVAPWTPLLPGSSFLHTTYYPALPRQLLPAVSPLFRLYLSSPCFSVGSGSLPDALSSELLQSLSSHPTSLPSLSSSDMRFCTLSPSNCIPTPSGSSQVRASWEPAGLLLSICSWQRT